MIEHSINNFFTTLRQGIVTSIRFTHDLMPPVMAKEFPLVLNVLSSIANTNLAIQMAHLCETHISEGLGFPLGLALGTTIGSNLLSAYSYAFMTKDATQNCENNLSHREALYNNDINKWIANNIRSGGVGFAASFSTKLMLDYLAESYLTDETVKGLPVEVICQLTAGFVGAYAKAGVANILSR